MSLNQLPTDPGQSITVMGQVQQVAGRTLLVLPIAAPVGRSRGHRIRVAIGDRPASTRLALVVAGQLALRLDKPEEATLGVPVTVRTVPRRHLRRIPRDLAAALAEEELDLCDLPGHEADQLLLLVKESASPGVRAARITAAVAAVKSHRNNHG